MLRFKVPQISVKIILIVLTSIILIHIVVMLLYTQTNKAFQQEAKRDAIIQKVINVIHLVNATPAFDRAKAVSAIDDPRLKVSLTKEAKWDLRFSEISFWAINKELRRHFKKFEISLLIGNGSWLNISANYVTYAYIQQIVLVVLELVAASAVLLALWAINRFTAPLENFKSAAERLGVDMEVKPIVEYGPAIVRETAHAMNQMQNRIRDLIRDRTQMLAAISHDLRTPITRMKLRLNYISNLDLQQKMWRDLDEMERMITETLAFSKTDAKNESRTTLDMVSFLQSICNEMEDLHYPVSFSVEGKPKAYKGQKLALKRAFTNIINNGIKYGQKVDVKLKFGKKGINIFFEDYGKGIPQEDMDKVFAPFYRAEPSRSRHTGGVGLGLAVVRDIIRAHGGKIELNNKQDKGLSVYVNLPY